MDRLYQNYVSDHSGLEDPASMRWVLDRDLLPFISAPQARCLDLGCGQGGLSAYLRERGIEGAFGVDISPQQVRLAHSLGRNYVVCDSVEAFLGGRKESWDVVTAFDFLEHVVPGQQLATLEMVRAGLAPGGLFVARVPNAAGPLFGRIQFGDFTHLSVFTQRSLQQLANTAGFSRTEFAEVPPVVHGVKSACRRVVWSAFSGLTRVAIAAESGQIRGHLLTSNLMAYLYV